MARKISDKIEPADFLAFKDSESDPLQRAQLVVPDFQDPRGYQRPEGLFEAFDAAMLLGLPLLITGEPGTGKTQAAYWLSQTLGENSGKEKDEAPVLLRTDVKSSTGGRDLLYRFDEVARFRDSAPGGTLRPLIDYIEFEALGEAIVRAAGGKAALKVLGSKSPEEVCLRAFGRSEGAMVAADLLPGDSAFKNAKPTCRVVLIDELDKAPRDTPNDLLAEVENMAFSIPELGLRVDAAAGAEDPRQRQRPIVVITSNSERDLPEPFLRRCAFFHIAFPAMSRSSRSLRSGSSKASARWTNPARWPRARRSSIPNCAGPNSPRSPAPQSFWPGAHGSRGASSGSRRTTGWKTCSIPNNASA